MTAVAYGSLPFSEQIQFLRAKRNVLTDSYLDVFAAEHDVAFMVAGANRDDLLADFRASIDKVIAEGATLEEFRADFDRIVAQYGWDYTGGRNWRSRVIYETNLRQSYNAGRWEQLQRLKRARPYWRYRHSDAVEHPRPIHEGWDSLVLSADDPWWLTHFPANGWGCQCYVEALNERDLERLGKSGPDSAPPIEMQTVTVGQRSPGGPRQMQTPLGVDPGFGYAPGRSLGGGRPPGTPRTPPSLIGQVERTTQMAIDKTTRLPARQAAQQIEQLLAMPRVLAALDSGYAQFLKDVGTAGQAHGRTYVVGALDSELVTSMTSAGAEPASAAIVARDAEILLSPAESTGLPAALRTADAVLLDQTGQALLYVGTSAHTAISIGYRLAGSGTITINALQKFSRADIRQLRELIATGRLKVLRGSL